MFCRLKSIHIKFLNFKQSKPRENQTKFTMALDSKSTLDCKRVIWQVCTSPARRQSHSTVVYRSGMYDRFLIQDHVTHVNDRFIFGGYSENKKYFNDLF